jgi:uncharacterized protein YqgV (UPF0045/DUF77 family)
MSIISAQVSLYPLKRASIGPAIREAVRILRQRGLKARVGEMSTVIWGEELAIFDALREAFHQAAKHGDAVMVATLRCRTLLRRGGIETLAAIHRRWESAHRVVHHPVPQRVAMVAIDPALGRVHWDGLTRVGRIAAVEGVLRDESNLRGRQHCL